MQPTTPPAPAWLPFAIIIGFPLVFIPFWCGICALISVSGGWAQMASRFKAPEGFKSGQIFRTQSGRIGWANYNHVLMVGISPEGLYLSVTLFFRCMQPNLLIPWTEIKDVRQKQILWAGVTSFSIGSPTITTVQLANPKILEAAKPYLVHITNL